MMLSFDSRRERRCLDRRVSALVPGSADSLWTVALLWQYLVVLDGFWCLPVVSCGSQWHSVVKEMARGLKAKGPYCTSSLDIFTSFLTLREHLNKGSRGGGKVLWHPLLILSGL